MKIIKIDNFWRESFLYPDSLIEEDITKEYGTKRVEELNKDCRADSDYVYMLVEDDYKLNTYEV